MKSLYKSYSLLIFCLLALLIGCSKDDLGFKDFLKDGEKVYPGRVSAIVPKPGNLRVGLWFSPNPDPSVTKYVIYWNNKVDSMVVNAVSNRPQDTVRVIIPGLNEYAYSFVVYSLDAAGHRSIPIELPNVRIYGPLYQSGLLNRPYNASNPSALNDDGSLTLNFNTPDTINVNTVIKYTNTANAVVEKVLLPKDTAVTLPGYKTGSEVLYKSAYIPGRGAIDTFYVSAFSTFPAYVYRDVQCDKSLMKAVSLPHDVYADFDTSFDKLWDGSVGPQGYPNIFHSNGSTLPHHFTFDLGKTYRNLVIIEETGRNQSHNPIEFEVWGINDLTGAATTLASNDPGWKAESLAKGWVLLKDAVRTDDGQAALKFDLISNPPPVRYIRIRVKKVASGDSSYSNISELTFWNRQ